jgi:hypothetical protein
MKKISFWDVLAWIILALILVWLVLKTWGIINTPNWLEYAPLYGAVYLAGWQMHKLTTVAADAKDLKKFKEATINEINSIKTNCIKNHK